MSKNRSVFTSESDSFAFAAHKKFEWLKKMYKKKTLYAECWIFWGAPVICSTISGGALFICDGATLSYQVVFVLLSVCPDSMPGSAFWLRRQPFIHSRTWVTVHIITHSLLPHTYAPTHACTDTHKPMHSPVQIFTHTLWSCEVKGYALPLQFCVLHFVLMYTLHLFT